MKFSKFRKISRWPIAAVIATTVGFGVVQAAEVSAGHQSTSSEEAPHAHGARLYQKYCALCHGVNGEGYAADNANALGNQDFLATVSDEFLRLSIARGRPGTAMAAHAKRYGGPLGEEDIDALVDLIRGWQVGASANLADQPVLGDPIAGRDSYDRLCAGCHGDRGQGVTAISLSNPEFLALASDAQIRAAIANGRRGTPMEAYHDRISQDSIDDLVALIRSWQRDVTVRAEEPELEAFPDVVLNPDGPAPEFTLRDGRYLSAAQLDAAMRNGSRMILLDARPPSDWYLAHIPGAVPAPAYDPDSIILLLPEDGTWIISYCACPHKYSDRLTDALRSAGFQNTAVLDEGVSWWQQQGYPIKYGP